MKRMSMFAAVAVAAISMATAAAAQSDPRAGLKAGVKAPGVAISHMRLVSTTFTPAGFTDANFDENATAASASAPDARGRDTGGPAAGSNYANSDIAFSGTRVIQGNYQGFNVWDMANPAKPKLVSSTVCPGGQHDVGVYGNLMFMSVENPRGRLDCGAGGSTDAANVNKERFRGIRIFDISNIASPKQIAAVQTCQGSHTLTLIPAPKERAVYVYNQGTSTVRSSDELAGCSADANDPRTALFSIDVIKVPLDAPEKAAIVSHPRLFADAAGSQTSVLSKKTDARPDGSQPARETRNCHDITVYPAVGLAGGACQGNGLLLDISDPPNPKRLDAVTDPNFAAWHSATFANSGKKVLFTDEWGGGSSPRCRPGDPQFWGGDAIFDIAADGKMGIQGHYKIPNNQGLAENCVAHNGNLVPVPGRDVMVQGWYQGGVSVLDFTDAKKPFEIAFFDRGPLSADKTWLGGYWSIYWNNGYIVGSEIARGLDVLELEPSAMLSKNEIAAAKLIQNKENNPQTQMKIVWPDKPVVARAYLDQLVRGKAIDAGQAASVDQALTAMEKGTKGANTALIAQIKAAGAKANGRNVERYDGIARILAKA
jgi:hypothetical protein